MHTSFAHQLTHKHSLIQLHLSGEAILNLLKLDLKPRDIMTKKAFENAITIVMVLGKHNISTLLHTY